MQTIIVGKASCREGGGEGGGGGGGGLGGTPERAGSRSVLQALTRNPGSSKDLHAYFCPLDLRLHHALCW